MNNTRLIKNRVKSQMLRKGKQFLFHQWNQPCYSCSQFRDKTFEVITSIQPHQGNLDGCHKLPKIVPTEVHQNILHMQVLIECYYIIIGKLTIEKLKSSLCGKVPHLIGTYCQFLGVGSRYEADFLFIWYPLFHDIADVINIIITIIIE